MVSHYCWPRVPLTILHEFLEMCRHCSSDFREFFAHHSNIPVNKHHGRNVFINYGRWAGCVEDLMGPSEGFYNYSVCCAKLTPCLVILPPSGEVILVRVLVCPWEIASLCSRRRSAILALTVSSNPGSAPVSGGRGGGGGTISVSFPGTRVSLDA